jgi:hypothetical protein
MALYFGEEQEKYKGTAHSSSVASLYFLEVLCCVKKYKESLKQNFMILEHITRSKYDLHTQFCNTALFQKSVLNTGVKLYKNLPSK